MKALGITVATLLCIGLSALAAQGALVHYTFNETSSGNWEVLVQVTPESSDTTGLSAYGFYVDANPALVSYTQNVLSTTALDFSVYGFLPGNVSQGDVGGKFNAGGFQTAGAPLYDVGIAAIDDPGGYPPGTPHIQLGVPALLGTVTTPTGLTLTTDLYPDGAGLFNGDGSGTGYHTSPPTPTWEVNPIPEPATMLVLGVGAVMVLLRRRRS